MKYLLIIILFTTITACSLFKSSKAVQNRVMLGQVIYGNGISSEEISELKVDAAFALAMRLSRKYEFVDIFQRDSLASLLSNESGNTRLIDIAHKSGAEKIAFLRIDRFNNILRIDIVLVDSGDSTQKSNGEGYSFVNFRSAKTNKAIFDPSLLAALQRSFASAVNDSALYAKAGGKFAVKPVPTIVPAGMEFNNFTKSPNWDLFSKKTVSSFTAVESIFIASKDSPDFVAYDIETRDSIYSLFKLYLVENYSMPSLQEVDALRRFKLNYYIAGSYIQQQEQADLSLSLFEITPNDVFKHHTVYDTIYKDNIVDFRNSLEKMTRELLKIPTK